MQLETLRELVKSLRKDATTAGITTGTGLNFYYLEDTAKTIYPVMYPLLASIPRTQPMMFGNPVGGTAVNWKAITGIDTGGYPGVSEGNRNEFMSFTEKDYTAAYKFLGKDDEVSFQAQQSGLGFEDNIGIAQVSLLNALLNDEERMILYGNSGSGGNGFQLGQCGQPTCAQAVVAGGTLSGSTVYVRCIALTGWGSYLATATGVALPRTRANADGSQDVINGGTSAVSNASAGLPIDGGHQGVTASVTAIAGAMAYAWYIDATDGATNHSTFSAITSCPSITIKALPAGGNQKANASNSTGNLTTDNSANTMDFDGLSTWGFNYAHAAQPSYWTDLNGANLTAVGDGTIAEIEAMLDFFWQQYKITPDKLWLGGTIIRPFAKAIIGAGTSNTATRLFFEADQAGRLVGGTFAVAYRSKYGPGQVKQIEVETHPWLPQGVILADLQNNPYPSAGSAIPAVRRIVTLQDHFSIKWPYRRLMHELGVYSFETLQHYIPFGIGLITGVGNG